MHDTERPIALLTSIYVNSKRDRKKAGKPASYLDFCFYKAADKDSGPSGQYGAAMLELIKLKKNPAWTLFCFKDLAQSADSTFTGDTVALVSKDAILLNPTKDGSTYRGMLIAEESASDQMREFISTDGEKVTLKVPYVETKVVARENEVLWPR
jgi:predicted component of type VI protein secretion system